MKEKLKNIIDELIADGIQFGSSPASQWNKSVLKQQRQKQLKAIIQLFKDEVEKMKRPYNVNAIPMCQIGHTTFCDCETWNEALDQLREKLGGKEKHE